MAKFTSKNRLDRDIFWTEQILVQNNPGPRQDQGCMEHFLCQRNKKITQTGAK